MHPARSQLHALDPSAGASDTASSPNTLETPRRYSPIDRICVAAMRSILVIDDNDRHLDILDTILTSVGHDVETCGSGAEAVRRLAEQPFDVVVLDFVMPEISGEAVAEAMRAGTVNVRTPIIVCSANVVIARRKLADVKGVAAFIGKPIDTASLILAVARAPAQERAAGDLKH